MKAIFSLLLAASLGSAFAQCASPYNPDSDGDGVIGSSDLIGLLTTFGNPFCGYDSLNVQTVSDTSAVIDEDTDIIFVEGINDVTPRNIELPSGTETKVLIVFLKSAPNGLYWEIDFYEDSERVGTTMWGEWGVSSAGNKIVNVVRFNGTWYVSSI